MDLLGKIVDLSLRHRFVVILLTAVAALLGAVAVQYIDIDAFPDTTPVQVQVNTVAVALGPEEIEQRITFPIEQALSGLPGLEQLRSISKFGLSQIVLVFRDNTDIYRARQLVVERLATVQLPDETSPPQLGPVATGLGEVLHYVVTGQGTNITDLRTIHDWVIRPVLRTVPGVAEINSWGGYRKQYEIHVDPEKLAKYKLTFQDIFDAVRKNNLNVGGGSISHQQSMVLVQGVARPTQLNDLKRIVVATRQGVPIRIEDVAEVAIGHEIRRGAVSANGQGEAVLGLGFMLMGENSHRVTHRLKEKLQSLAQNLPANIQVNPLYDRTELVDAVIDTVRKNLFEGGLLVIAVLFAFMGSIRAAMIVALAIPLSMLFAFSGMYRFGIAASLLSLGALDFGMIVDSSVVMVENCVRRLSGVPSSPTTRREVIRRAALEVRRPTLFGECIIMIVYLPILTLEGVEGKLFRPMALTVIFALFGSMILSVTLMPVLASFWLAPSRLPHQPLLMRLLQTAYKPVLHFTMKHQALVLALAAGLLIVAFAGIAPRLGAEFVPRLSEGAIAIGVVRLAGTDLNQSVRYNTQMEKAILAAFPDEVANVWSRTGTAEVATDPMGVELTDIFVTLKPRSQWKKVRTQDELVAQLDLLLRDLPGQRLAFSQPIEMRLNEMVSGVRADLAVKLFGDDLAVLEAKAQEIASLLANVPGATDVAVEQVTGQPTLRVKVRHDQIARYGISAQSVLEVIESLGGKTLGELVEGQLRFPLVVRLPESLRHNLDALRAMLVTTADGRHIPLSRLADLEITQGPTTITREWAQRRITVTANVRGRDLASFVREVQQRIEKEIALPSSRYRVEYGGQFEHLQRAQKRLVLATLLAFSLVFALLYLTYHNLVDTLRVFTGIPFAWVGGIFALWIRDMPFSVSAGIGFIAMSGLAVLDDMILVSTIRRLRQDGVPLEDAVRQAALMRLRPVLMTSLVAALGFLPMATSTGVGAEVQRPLATVVIGGVISATFMTLLVLRALYILFAQVAERDQNGAKRGEVVDPQLSRAECLC